MNAQTVDAGKKATPASEAKKSDAKTPKPEELLQAMEDFLGKLPAYTCQIDTEMHFKAQHIDEHSKMALSLSVMKPNRIAIQIDSEQTSAAVVSDGKQLTQFISALNRYTVEDAPKELAELWSEQSTTVLDIFGVVSFAIPVPGGKFFTGLQEDVVSTEYVGLEKIDGVECHHCRFIKEDADWNVWIETGDRPVVRRVVPDMSKQLAAAGQGFEDAKLEYKLNYTKWDTAPKLDDAAFAVNLPKDAEKVDSMFEGLGGSMEEELHGLVGKPAPAFETVNPAGDAIDLSKNLGKNVIMLDFWATWCGPCVQALPAVNGVAQKLADKGLVFYAVNAGEDAETISEFLKSQSLEVPVAMDQEGKISRDYLVNGIPQTVLIGKDGKVQVVHVGFGGALEEQLTQQIEDLLAGKDLASEAIAEAEEAKKKSEAEVEQDGTSDAESAESDSAGE